MAEQQQDFAMDLSDGEKTMYLITGLFDTLSSAINAFGAIKTEIDKGKPENAARIAMLAEEAHTKAIGVLLRSSATPMNKETAEAFIASAKGQKH